MKISSSWKPDYTVGHVLQLFLERRPFTPPKYSSSFPIIIESNFLKDANLFED